jgi:protein O-mannosyl-transferase
MGKKRFPLSRPSSSSREEVSPENKSSNSIASWMDAFNWPLLGCSCFIYLFAFVLFSPALEFQYALDDRAAIMKNIDISPFLEPRWTSLFWKDFWGDSMSSSSSHKSYRPLSVMSFRLDFWRAGWRDPAMFHSTNIHLHAIACVSLLVTLYLAGKAIFASTAFLANGRSAENTALIYAFIVAIIFAVHPVHVENVCNVVGRADILAFIFGIWSLFCWTKRYTITAIVLLLAATFSKEIGLSNVPVLFAISIFHHSNGVGRRSVGSALSLLSLSVMGYFTWRWYIANGVMGVSLLPFSYVDNPLLFLWPDLSLFSKFLSGCFTLSYYVQLVFWPRVLAYDYSYPNALFQPLWSWVEGNDVVPAVEIWGRMAGVLGLLLMPLLCWWRYPSRLTTFFVLLISGSFAQLLLQCNMLLPVGTVLAERTLYGASASLIAAAVLLILLLSKTAERYHLKAVASFFILLLFICATFFLGMKTVHYAPVWHNDSTLFTQTPTFHNTSKTLYNAFVFHKRLGEVERAIEYAAQSTIGDSYDITSFVDTILGYTNLGEIEKAMQWWPAMMMQGPSPLGSQFFGCEALPNAPEKLEPCRQKVLKGLSAVIPLIAQHDGTEYLSYQQATQFAQQYGYELVEVTEDTTTVTQ